MAYNDKNSLNKLNPGIFSVNKAIKVAGNTGNSNQAGSNQRSM